MSESALVRGERLFEAALELDPERRDAFIERECAGDSELRRELLELLASDLEAGDFFDRLHGDIAASSQRELDNASRPKIEIGPYRVVELLGQGGMGVVYRAERVDGAFEQQVALKLLHLDLLTPEMQARFAAERQLLARLSHPHIARLQDGGVTSEGRPYFVMEYVDGQPLDRFAATERLGVKELLRLFSSVIDAVSYLHRNLIVHRDLKPSNLFVDREGTIKLLDFGIAKLLVEDGDRDAKTITGHQLLTPKYAAPEQLAGGPITTSTDVYALGVVLYQLLTGRVPGEADGQTGLLSGGETAPPPSVVVRDRRRSGQDSASESGLSWRQIAGDLDKICLKALRPEPERRYASAAQLGDDIERFLSGLPIRARASTLRYRATTFVKRHKGGVAAGLAAVALVSFGFVRERGLRERAEVAREIAESQTAKADSVSDFLSELLSSSDPARAQGAELTVDDVLRQASARLDDETPFADQPEIEAAARLTLGRTYQALGLYERASQQLRRALELAGGVEGRSLNAAEIAESLALAASAHQSSPAGYGAAEALLRRVLEIRVERLGSEHPETVTTLSHLGRNLRNQLRYDEAEQIARQVLEIRRATVGSDHLDTLLAMNNVAGLLFQTGRYAAAAEVYQRAMRAAQRTLGHRHPETLRLGSNLGAALSEQGAYREAEGVLRGVVEGRVEVLGEDHTSTAMSLHNLATTLMELGRLSDAEPFLERAIAARYSGGARPGYLYSRSHLADLYRDQGRYQEAESIYRETYSEQVKSAGLDDPDSLRTAGGLAELQYRTGRLGSAEAWVLEVLERLEVVFPTDPGEPGHPGTLGPLLTLARVRNSRGLPVEGLRLAESAVDSAVRTLGPQHPLALEARFVAVQSLRALGRYNEALALAEVACEGRKRRLGDKHPDTAEALHELEELRELATG